MRAENPNSAIHTLELDEGLTGALVRGQAGT